MDNKELAMIYKGLSHILYNQKFIMEHISLENFCAVQNTEDLATSFGQLAKMYYGEDE